MPDAPNREALDGYLVEVMRGIAEHGHICQGVFPVEEGDDPFFVYTVGLTEQGHPELLISGIDGDMAANLLNDLAYDAEHMANIDAGRDITSPGDPTLVLRIRPVLLTTAPIGVARALYGGNVRVMQVIWPDDNNVYPDDDAFMYTQKMYT